MLKLNGGEGGGWRLRGNVESVKVIIESFGEAGEGGGFIPNKAPRQTHKTFHPLRRSRAEKESIRYKAAICRSQSYCDALASSSSLEMVVLGPSSSSHLYSIQLA